jgi:hypothetical protein
MQFDVIYLETWGGTQPYVAFSTLEFRSGFFVFGRTLMALNFLTLYKASVCCGLCQVFLVGSLVELVFLVLQ